MGVMENLGREGPPWVCNVVCPVGQGYEVYAPSNCNRHDPLLRDSSGSGSRGTSHCQPK
jgi:hypothetical protein